MTTAAVLASGGGSNVQALIEHLSRDGEQRPWDIVLVASDRAQAGALDRARAAGIPTALVRTAAAPERESLADLLDRVQPDLLVLAGYLRLVSADVTRQYAGRIVNVHPGPLPEFGGAGMFGERVHRAVLAAGVRESAASVHYVDEVFDRGAVIVRWPVPVLDGDTAATLGARVLRAEHLLLPRVVRQMCIRFAVHAGDALRLPDPPLFDETLSFEALGDQLDAIFSSVPAL